MGPSKNIKMGTACYHVLHSVPPIVAHEMNFFVDEGLVDDYGDRAYDLLPGGIAPFNAERESLAQCMKERGVSIAMDVKPSTVAYLNRRGAKLRIIAGWRNQQHNWLMSRPEIKTLDDIRGKVVGLKDFRNVRYFALVPILRAAGIDPDNDLTYVRNIQDGALALREGAVDVAFVAPQLAPELAAEGYTTLVNLADAYPNGRPDRIIVATEEIIDERPDWVAAYIRGMIRSYWFMRTMPDNLFYLGNLERRLRLSAADPDERNSPFLTCGSIDGNERMPFPLDAIPTGLEEYMQTWVEAGNLEQADADELAGSLRIDLAEKAFADLMANPERQAEHERVRAVVARIGY
jgi:ABC-type nitrate/sulfonate/bicarbonate transport system substrate-binding protein